MFLTPRGCGYNAHVDDESRDFRRLTRGVAIRTVAAMIFVAVGSWAASGFERTWVEVAASAGVIGIVAVAGQLLGAPDKPGR